MEKAKYYAEESILLYSDNSILRLAVLQIKGIGLVIDNIITTKGQSITYQRLLDFYRQLKDAVEDINERKIDSEYINSEEFYDLFIKISAASIKTRHDEKRRMFAKIMTSTLTNELNGLSPEYYVNVIDELCIEEIIVAKKLYELKVLRKEEYSNMIQQLSSKNSEMVPDKEILALSGLNILKEDYPFILLRLQRAGLIKEMTGSYYGYSGGIYEITDTFKRIIKLSIY